MTIKQSFQIALTKLNIKLASSRNIKVTGNFKAEMARTSSNGDRVHAQILADTYLRHSWHSITEQLMDARFLRCNALRLVLRQKVKGHDMNAHS